MKAHPDKLRILLVDDDPTYFYDEIRGDVFLPNGLKEHFELIWVQNPVEARVVLDWVEEHDFPRPHIVAEEGLPPELLIFDYAMTTKLAGDWVRSPSDPSNIVARLTLRKEYPAMDPETVVFETVRLVSSDRDDRFGLYLGGAFARAFHLHPCGAVPTTGKVTTEGTDGAFFEWVNEKYFGGLFESKSRQSPTWNQVLAPGVRSLRDRIVALASGGVIRCSVGALQAILGDSFTISDGVLPCKSRYGTRNFPLYALFLDSPEGDKSSAARQWATQLLETLFRSNNVEEFSQARLLANSYALIRQSKLSMDRFDLAALASQEAVSDEHTEHFARLCKQFGICEKDALTNPTASVSLFLPPIWDNASGNVARLATLMLMVRAEQEMRGELEIELGFFEALRDEGFSLDFPWLVEFLGEDVLSQLTFDHARSELQVERAATDLDIFRYLDPLPQHILTFVHREKGSTFITNPIKRKLGRLSVKSVRTMNEDGSGLHRGEGQLLRLYADECNFDERHWPVWLKESR